MNIETLKKSLQASLAELDTMSIDADGYSAKLEEAEGYKAKIEELEQLAKRQESLKQSASAFAPKVSQSVSEPNIIVKKLHKDDPTGGFSCSGEFLNAVVKCQNDPMKDERLFNLHNISMTSGVGNTTADGIVIPTEFAQGLLLNESGITEQDWLSRMTVEQTSTNAKTFKRSSSNTLGGSTGITASRIAENTQMTSTKEVFETTTLGLEKLYVYSEVTEEDLEDISWLSSHLSMQAPKVIRKKFAGEVMNGTGVGEAQGMFNTNNANKIQVTRNAASTVKAEDIAAMYARHIAGSNSFWVINQDTIAKLPLMAVANTAVTWQPFFSNGSVGLLCGLPVYKSEECSALGTAGDVRLINPDGYRILEKVGGMKFASSMHVKFDYDRTAFRWTHRINGIAWCNDVYTPTKGATLSPFVELGSA